MKTGYRSIAAGVLASAMMLGGCSNDVETVHGSLTAIEEEENRLIDELTQLVDLEDRLQQSFESTLEGDESLRTFSDGTSEVYSNIEERETILGALDSIEEELGGQHEVLNDIDGESVPEEGVSEVTGSLEALNGTLDTFSSSYNESLETQDNFFTSLGQEDSTFETLQTGIEEINSEQEESRQQLAELDQHISSLRTARQELESGLEADDDDND